MEYQFKTTPGFWKSFNALGPREREAALKAFKIFRVDPFDSRLRPHQINQLSARYKTTVRSVTILGDLRAVFTIQGNTVVSFDIGTHDIYR